MIVLNNVGIMKKCNLWINERPNIEYKCLKELNEVIVKDNWLMWDSVSYMIEIYLKQRHSSNYALLGMSYEHDDVNKLKIKVNSSGEDGEIIENTLVFKSDEVHAGIPSEYSEEVLKRAKIFLNSVDCSSGTIIFDIGGHGYIGSSSAIFGTASEILLKLLINNKDDIRKIEKIVFDQLNS